MEYNKLIRDKIPEIIIKEGKKVNIEILNNEDYFDFLNIKLNEELNEYFENNNIEELADLVEVVYALLEFNNISIEEFERIRTDKVNKKGAFKKRILLKEVIDQNNM
jgi:predicted house-cleaning noncanonical NTP pyrophosphatase (MazG superfamily)